MKNKLKYSLIGLLYYTYLGARHLKGRVFYWKAHFTTCGLEAVSKRTAIFILIALILQLALPMVAIAQDHSTQKQKYQLKVLGLEQLTNQSTDLKVQTSEEHQCVEPFTAEPLDTVVAPQLPLAQIKNPKGAYYITVTAYTSRPGETDNTPCITASGFDLCQNNSENIVATNLLPFGAHVRFPEIWPDKLFRVEDRMNERYYHRMDIWMFSKDKAINFGHKRLKMEVY